MSERVTMPALGESVTEGTVTRWLKSVGDTVEVDEPLLEVSTDKVDTEIPSPVAGMLQEILVEEDDTVPVGADLAVIGDGSGGGSEQPRPPSTRRRAEQAAEAPAAEQPPPERTPRPSSPPPRAPPASSAGEAPAAGQSGGSGEGTTVTMPALGESVTEGTVTRWLKAEGDEVAVDEPLLEVSTDKVDTEIPSPVAGTLSKILVDEDETVPVGADLAVVGGSGAGAAPSAPPQAAARAAGRGARAGGRAPALGRRPPTARPRPAPPSSRRRPSTAGREQSLTEDKPRVTLRPPRRQRPRRSARAGRRARRHVR